MLSWTDMLTEALRIRTKCIQENNLQTYLFSQSFH